MRELSMIVGVPQKHSYRVRKDNFNRLMRLYSTDMLVDKIFNLKHWVILKGRLVV